MSMKFGLLIDVDLRKRVTIRNLVVWSRRGCHLEIVYDVITPLRVARFGRILVMSFRKACKLLRSGQNHKRKKNSNRQINKNLAIANRSRVSCAHNTLRASIGINITP